MPPISMLIKPASSKCNLNCEYCFYHDVANSRAVADFGFINLETIEVIITKVLQFASGHATFSFFMQTIMEAKNGFFREPVFTDQNRNQDGEEPNCVPRPRCTRFAFYG